MSQLTEIMKPAVLCTLSSSRASGLGRQISASDELYVYYLRKKGTLKAQHLCGILSDGRHHLACKILPNAMQGVGSIDELFTLIDGRSISVRQYRIGATSNFESFEVVIQSLCLIQTCRIDNTHSRPLMEDPQVRSAFAAFQRPSNDRRYGISQGLDNEQLEITDDIPDPAFIIKESTVQALSTLYEELVDESDNEQSSEVLNETSQTEMAPALESDSSEDGAEEDEILMKSIMKVSQEGGLPQLSSQELKLLGRKGDVEEKKEKRKSKGSSNGIKDFRQKANSPAKYVAPVEKVTPPVEKVTPLVEKVTPPVEKVTPPVEKVTPLVDQAVASVDQVTPLGDKVTPPVEKLNPPIEKAALIIQKAISSVKKVVSPSQPITTAIRNGISSLQNVTPSTQKVVTATILPEKVVLSSPKLASVLSQPILVTNANIADSKSSLPLLGALKLPKPLSYEPSNHESILEKQPIRKLKVRLSDTVQEVGPVSAVGTIGVMKKVPMSPEQSVSDVNKESSSTKSIRDESSRRTRPIQESGRRVSPRRKKSRTSATTPNPSSTTEKKPLKKTPAPEKTPTQGHSSSNEVNLPQKQKHGQILMYSQEKVDELIYASKDISSDVYSIFSFF